MSAPASFFIGILPPPAFAQRVSAWQAQQRHLITAPHVTVQPPLARPRGVWQAAAQRAAEQHAPFEVRLSSVETFGERVIFLAVHSPGLQALHSHLQVELGSAGLAAPSRPYHPHLTLALSWRPLRGTWAHTLAAAQEAFADLAGKPLTFSAKHLTLFKKSRAGQPYFPVQQFAFLRKQNKLTSS